MKTEFLISKVENGVGVITLNNPKGLNALNLEMIKGMKDLLVSWENDSHVHTVIFDSQNEKAFCAGGDVVSLYNWMKEGNANAGDFFRFEYDLDLYIHHYKKPIICFADKIVMGGGIGIMNGCRYRLVTEKTMLAMPEITIGLFPDVGGSYFLNQMAGLAGLFLGLTGARFNGADAVYLKMADYLIESSKLSIVKDEILNGKKIETVLSSYHSAELQLSPVKEKQVEIDRLMNGPTIADIESNLRRYSGADEWITRAIKTFTKGSPLSAGVIFEQIKRGAGRTIDEALATELILARNFTLRSDFQEGVRALLIDKDNAPKWKYQDLSKVCTELVDSFFTK